MCWGEADDGVGDGRRDPDGGDHNGRGCRDGPSRGDGVNGEWLKWSREEASGGAAIG